MFNRNTITLNGQPSSEITGLIIQELPPISKPLIRTEVEEIDGRDGDIVTALGYSSYNKEISVGVYGDYDINEIIAYFNSEGIVTFSNEPDKYYNYQIIQQIDFERLVRYRTATVTFHCQPFKYSTTEGEEILDPPAQNLLSIPDFNKTTNGLTLTVSDGVISVSGTPSAATEFYVPTGGLSLPAGTFTLSAQANGTRVAAASIRLIGSVPSDADSLGGNYVGLKNGQEVSIKGTISAAKTFNYLWFYITAGGAIDFSMTAKVENEAEKVVSDEGTTLMLLNTPEAPFSRFDLKGNTYQQTTRGINLFNTQTRGLIYNTEVVSKTDNEVIVKPTANYGSGDFYVEYKNIPVEANTKYTIQAKKTIIGATNTSSNRGLIKVTAYRSNGGTQTLAQLWNTNTANQKTFTTTSDTVSLIIGFQSLRGEDDNWQNIVIAYSDIQIEKGSTATEFEPYTNGTAAPNPDYPQEIMTVKHQNMVRLTGKNLVSINELYLSSGAERTSDGLQATVTSDTLPTYYSGSVANPIGIYTVSFEARVSNAEAATLVLDSAGIWDSSDLTIKDMDGNEASETYRTLGGSWKKYSFTVTAYTSEPWTSDRAMTLYFSTYTNSPVLELRNFQIEAGAAASDYDGSAPQMYPIDFRTGKNMLSTDFLTLGGLVGGAIDLSTQYRVNDALTPIKVNPNSTYTISADLGGTVQGMRVGVQECDENTVFLQDNGWHQLASGAYTFTTRGDTEYIKLVFSLSTTDADVTDSTENTTVLDTVNEWLRGATLQVEEGDTATAYEEYECIELCKIGDYQDNIRKLGDDWYVHKETDKIESYDGETINTDYISTTGQLTTGATVYYGLTTPTDTKITNATTLETLNALKNQSHAYKGVTFVSSLPSGSSDLPLISAVEVVKSSDGVVTNAGNYYAKPQLTIYGSGDIGISLNGNQIFQIALGDDDYITIDTASMEAYKDTTENLKNRQVTGEYDNFLLNPGENQITFSGIVTKCIVKNYSRWL